MKNSYNRNKIDNRGISLVELIVVISIMVIIAGAISIGYGVVSTKPATECAEKIQIALNRSRITTMGKLNGYIRIYKNDAGYVLMTETYDSETTSPTVLTKKAVTVKYGDSELGESGLIISFRRSDGRLELFKFEDTSLAYEDVKDMEYVEFEVSKGSRTYAVRIQPITGKVTLVQK